MQYVQIGVGPSSRPATTPFASALAEAAFALLILRLFADVLPGSSEGAWNVVLSGLYIAPFPVMALASRKIDRLVAWVGVGAALLLLVSATLAFARSSEISAQLNAGARYFLYPATFFYAFTLLGKAGSSRAGLLHFRRRLLFVFAAALALAMIGFAAGWSREIQGQERYQYPFSNPNIMGLFFSLFCWLLVLYDFKLFGRLKFWSLLLLGASLGPVIYSGSLTANAVYFALLLAFAYRISTPTARLLSIPFVVAAAWYLAIHTTLYERIQIVLVSAFDEGNLAIGSSLIWRLNTWSTYLAQMGFTSWFIGHGLGASRIWFLDGAPGFFAYSIGDIPGTHNDYLAVLFDLGVGGLAVLAWAQAVFYRRCKRSHAPLLRSFCIVVYIAFFADNLLDNFVFVTVSFFVAALLSASKEPRSHINDQVSTTRHSA